MKKKTDSIEIKIPDSKALQYIVSAYGLASKDRALRGLPHENFPTWAFGAVVTRANAVYEALLKQQEPEPELQQAEVDKVVKKTKKKKKAATKFKEDKNV